MLEEFNPKQALKIGAVSAAQSFAGGYTFANRFLGSMALSSLYHSAPDTPNGKAMKEEIAKWMNDIYYMKPIAFNTYAKKGEQPAKMFLIHLVQMAFRIHLLTYRMQP